MKLLRQLVIILVGTLVVACFGGCGGKASSTIDDPAVFFEAYNKVASEIGAVEFSDNDIEPHTESDGFELGENVLQGMLIDVSPGIIRYVGNWESYDETYLVTEAIIMATMNIDKVEAEKITDDVINRIAEPLVAFTEGRYIPSDPTKAWSGLQESITTEKNGVVIHANIIKTPVGAVLLDMFFKNK